MNKEKTSQIVKSTGYLTPEECKELLQKNNFKAFIGIAENILWVSFAFALPYYYTNAFTIIVSLFILGGKQLSCAILAHDASHFSVFTNPKVNDFIGAWLGSYFVWQNLDDYRTYHNLHHINNGLQEADPDINLTAGYATTKTSMARKFMRDLIGLTGIKALSGLLLMNMGFLEYNLGNKVIWLDQKGRPFTDYFTTFFNKLGKIILAHIILWAILYSIASGWLFLLWFGAFLTTFPFCLRVRSISEHSVVPDSSDPMKNTRTTYANFLTRILFAPYNVNYHAEHHMIMGVPFYNLKKMHELIKQRGFYKKGILAPSYWSVVKLAASKQ